MLKIPHLYEIKKDVERHTGIKDIGIKSNKQEIVAARSLYVKIAREMPQNFSRLKIGAVIGKDAASVLNSERKFDVYMPIYPKYYRAYFKIQGMDMEARKVEIELERLKDKVFKLEKKIRDMKAAEVKTIHDPLIEVIKKVPAHHVETVKMRLEPIIKMLERPSRHNYLPQN